MYINVSTIHSKISYNDITCILSADTLHLYRLQFLDVINQRCQDSIDAIALNSRSIDNSNKLNCLQLGEIYQLDISKQVIKHGYKNTMGRL